METIYNWADVIIQSFVRMGERLSSGLVNLLGALLILLLGWLFTKLVVFLLKKLLKTIRIDKLTEKLNDTKLFGENTMKFELSYVVTEFVRWIMYLVFIIIAADIMQWTAISIEIGKLLSYLPQLFVAVALFIVGIYIAGFIRRAVRGVLLNFHIYGSRTISTIVFYIIVVIFTITALNQANVDTSLITGNVFLIVGGVMLALAIAFGVGSIKVVNKLLLGWMLQKKYAVGTTLTIGEISGKVVSVDLISVTLDTGKKKVVVPIKELADNTLEIKE